MQVTPFSRTAKTALRCISLVLASSLLTACSLFSGGAHDSIASDVPALEVPPDLVSPKGREQLLVPEVAAKTADADCAARGPELERISRRVLPPQKAVRFVRDGRHRWLAVDVEPEQMWPLARKFLIGRGYRIALDSPDIGLIETDWKARAGLDGGKSDLRERLRLRIEPGKLPGTAEVYLNQAQAERDADGVWVLRLPDEERSAEMLNRLARYLGDEDVGQAMPLTALDSTIERDEDNNMRLRIAAPWKAVWRRAGIALDNLGYIIEDRDRANRMYTVYTEVASGKTAEEVKYGKPDKATVRLTFILKVRDDDEETLISVLDKNGKPDNSQQASHLLVQIQSQFR